MPWGIWRFLLRLESLVRSHFGYLCGFLVAIVLAWCRRSLFQVPVLACLVVFVLEWL